MDAHWIWSYYITYKSPEVERYKSREHYMIDFKTFKLGESGYWSRGAKGIKFETLWKTLQTRYVMKGRQAANWVYLIGVLVVRLIEAIAKAARKGKRGRR